jgi:hypothetical protein
MKYRKKPVVIEAFQYLDAMPEAPPPWAHEASDNGVLFVRDNEWYIKTLEGEHHVSNGDWIIQGVKGELYPCKSDIFDASYEPVEAA